MDADDRRQIVGLAPRAVAGVPCSPNHIGDAIDLFYGGADVITR